MAPGASTSDLPRERVGPHPSYIEVAKPYILQSSIQRCLSELHMSDAKEDSVRLQGVAYIDQVRRALQLPVRTFNTAVIYYHKFRLLHADNEYNFADAAAAALFTACKIEDTLKKSREILAAHWNARVGVGESLSSDDPRFENHSKLIIGLERLMLESAGFDFRNRYPQKLMAKMVRALGFDRNNAAKTAWNLSIDLYRTFAPLKQTTPTMAVACVELAARLHELDASKVVDSGMMRYSKWNTTRAEVMETLLDLLDLYTHHRGSTSVGPIYPLETFINIRITLNQEASASNIPRYARYASESDPSHVSNGVAKPRNGIDPTSPLTPLTPGTISPGTAHPPTSAIGIRGQNGTVRFMLSAQRARDEKAEVDRYLKVQEEEYEVEVPISSEREGEKRRDEYNSYQEAGRQRKDSPVALTGGGCNDPPRIGEGVRGTGGSGRGIDRDTPYRGSRGHGWGDARMDGSPPQQPFLYMDTRRRRSRSPALPWIDVDAHNDIPLTGARGDQGGRRRGGRDSDRGMAYQEVRGRGRGRGRGDSGIDGPPPRETGADINLGTRYSRPPALPWIDVDARSHVPTISVRSDRGGRGGRGRGIDRDIPFRAHGLERGDAWDRGPPRENDAYNNRGRGRSSSPAAFWTDSYLDDSRAVDARRGDRGGRGRGVDSGLASRGRGYGRRDAQDREPLQESREDNWYTNMGRGRSKSPVAPWVESYLDISRPTDRGGGGRDRDVDGRMPPLRGSFARDDPRGGDVRFMEESRRGGKQWRGRGSGRGRSATSPSPPYPAQRRWRDT